MKKRNFTFRSSDGKTRIHAIEWVPDGEVRGVLQLVHGMVEFIGRYDRFARYMCAHGFYVETPHLALDRLKAINDAIDTPLVLHGGSGIPDDQITIAGQNGINKLNVGTEYGHLLYTNTRKIMEEGLSPREDWMWCMGALKPVMIEYLRRKLHALSY